ncbi:MAG TPA: SAM-dependent methyltransferase [Burkholderiales bacterium]|jgi:16S rRNA (cytidine1402-2'-O)-methyltransferase|nr:SAM-dependent methyltransferase [Burkholderiales bacterium]
MTAGASLGRLILIPADLAPGTTPAWAGAALRQAVAPLRCFVVEHPKAARQFLKSLGLRVQDLELHVLDEHSKPEDAAALARLLTKGDVGLISEAGCPAIADPGATLVGEAHRMGAPVVPLVGPSSLVLALMASGLNGQRFAFLGYLPARSPQREEALRAVEARSAREGETQVFIEAPYRNDPLFSALLATCKRSTKLCLATDLTSAQETIVTRTIEAWSKAARPVLDRRPTVFLLLAAPSANGAAAGRRA